jgi:uncharacterized membrane protein
MALGFLLMAIVLIWLAVAEAIYIANFGYAAPASIRQFVDDLFNTPAGWNLIIVGVINSGMNILDVPVHAQLIAKDSSSSSRCHSVSGQKH